MRYVITMKDPQGHEHTQRETHKGRAIEKACAWCSENGRSATVHTPHGGHDDGGLYVFCCSKSPSRFGGFSYVRY